MATNRRAFITGAALGAGAATLSYGNQQCFSADSRSDYPRRFVFIRKSNGVRPDEVALPTFSDAELKRDREKETLRVDLANHELPSWMQRLEPHKTELSILQGLSCKMSENGHWSYSSVMGAFKSGRNSLSGIKRATVDFEMAKLAPSPFGHVELSLTGNYSTFRTGIVPGYSAPGPHQRNYCYADPQTAYDELFKSVANPDAVASDNAMLRFLQEEESYKARVLEGHEKLKISNHVGSIEAIQARNLEVKKMSGAIAQHLPELDTIHQSGGANATTPEKQKAMTDILVAALVTGLTNVVTYTIDELSTPIKGLRGNEGDHISLHELGHNGGYSGVSANDIREKVRVGHMEQVATIVERLKAVPEGGGTMFDNTVVMYFPENGEGHHSHGTEAPFVVLAGNQCKLNLGGQYVRLPFHATEGHKTIGNWYTTLLNAYGNPIQHYGDFDLEMSRKKYDQSGAITELMS
ncbi:MAG: hypothetical protein CMM01_05505 [Rhodopirellula sp.]|nr:hypothetical protein [Rhodopirellula sp.]